MSSKRTSVNPLAGFLKPQPQLQPSAITSSSSSAQAAFTGGLSNSKINSRQGPPEVPSNSKINPQTPSRTEIENLINYLKVWSRSDRERTVYLEASLTHAHTHTRTHTHTHTHVFSITSRIDTTQIHVPSIFQTPRYSWAACFKHALTHTHTRTNTHAYTPTHTPVAPPSPTPKITMSQLYQPSSYCSKPTHND